MNELRTASGGLENTYLRFFKYFIVFMMTLALLAIVVLLPLVAYNFMQQPVPAAPAREPPERSISADDLKTFLINEEKRRIEAEKGGTAPATRQPAGVAPVSLLYGENVIALYRCSEEFGANAQQPVDNSTQSEISQRNERLRAAIESMAGEPFRGAPWVNAMVEFTCRILKSPEFAKLKKENAVGSVVRPTINFHASAWTRIEQEKEQFRNAEERRVGMENATEAVRVGLARLRAFTMLATAGACFGAFLLLALYLIFAKIEDNLRQLHLAALRYRPHGEESSPLLSGSGRVPLIPV